MKTPIKTEITVSNTPISVLRVGDEEYISLTDIARYRDARTEVVLQNWIRNRMTIEYLGLWEKLHNPNFKHMEFDVFKSEVGLSGYVLSPKQWIDKTAAVGIISKSGRYGGTFAHPNIAFKFAAWISPEFELYLITEFERLKKDEGYRNQIEWSVKRELAKTNYIIHTDAIKENLVPSLTDKQKTFAYANEADVLNVALFGMTAKEWRKQNPDAIGNIRDFTDVLHLVVLINLENLNAEMINNKISQPERLEKLNEIARKQLLRLAENNSVRKIEKLEKSVSKK